MGKRTKLREAQHNADELALAALLRLHKKIHPRNSQTTWLDFPARLFDRIETYAASSIRDPAGWRGPPKEKPVEERFLDLRLWAAELGFTWFCDVAERAEAAE